MEDKADSINSLKIWWRITDGSLMLKLGQYKFNENLVENNRRITDVKARQTVKFIENETENNVDAKQTVYVH